MNLLEKLISGAARKASELKTILWEFAREVFDEAGYERFLRSRGLANSREAYAMYLLETEGMRSRRPRCC